MIDTLKRGFFYYYYTLTTSKTVVPLSLIFYYFFHFLPFRFEYGCANKTRVWSSRNCSAVQFSHYFFFKNHNEGSRRSIDMKGISGPHNINTIFHTQFPIFSHTRFSTRTITRRKS